MRAQDQVARLLHSHSATNEYRLLVRRRIRDSVRRTQVALHAPQFRDRSSGRDRQEHPVEWENWQRRDHVRCPDTHRSLHLHPRMGELSNYHPEHSEGYHESRNFQEQNRCDRYQSENRVSRNFEMRLIHRRIKVRVRRALHNSRRWRDLLEYYRYDLQRLIEIRRPPGGFERRYLSFGYEQNRRTTHRREDQDRCRRKRSESVSCIRLKI